MPTPMKTLELPEELVDTLQAEALLAGTTVSEYLVALVVRPRDEENTFSLPAEVQEDIHVSLQQVRSGQVSEHAQVLERMYTLIQG